MEARFQSEKEIIFKEGIISSSLYRAAKKLDIEDKIIVDFANIYGFQIFNDNVKIYNTRRNGSKALQLAKKVI